MSHVYLLQVTCGGRESFIHRPFLIGWTIAGMPAAFSLEIRKEFLVRNLRIFLSILLEWNRWRAALHARFGRLTNEITVADVTAPGIALAAPSSQESRLRERRRAQDFAVEHPAGRRSGAYW